MKTKNFFGFAFFSVLFFLVAQAQSVPNFPTVPTFNIPDFSSSFPSAPASSSTVPNFPTVPTVPTTGTSSANTVRVTVVAYVDGSLATATSTNGATFSMGSNLGNFSLTSPDYSVRTVALPVGTSYSVDETMNNTVSTICSATSTSPRTPFSLIGYSVGNSLLEASNASVSSTSPSLTNIQTDKYIIVWNKNCNSSNTSLLKVDSIETLNNSGLANNTFDNGFRYMFNITMPANEPNLSMKFADWVGSGVAATIPAATNMRISSPQASSTAPILVNYSNTYTTPWLFMTGDLDSAAPGRQVKVLVEIKIPTNSANGSYSTAYGVRSQ